MNWPIWKRDRHLKPEEVSEYLDGRLSEKDVRRIEAHLEACPDCRREVESLQQTVQALHHMPLRQPRRSFVFSAPPVAAGGTARLEPAPRGGLGAAVAVIARPRIPRWAFGAVASACVVAFAVVLSMDLTGSYAPSPSLADHDRSEMLTNGGTYSTPSALATPEPEPTESARIGAAITSKAPEDDKSFFEKIQSTEGVQPPSGEAANDAEALRHTMRPGAFDAEQGTWWVWHLAEGLLAGAALTAAVIVLLRRRVPVSGR